MDEAEPEAEVEPVTGPRPRPPLSERHGSGVSRRALFFLPNVPGSSGDHELTANGFGYANASCYLFFTLQVSLSKFQTSGFILIGDEDCI